MDIILSDLNDFRTILTFVLAAIMVKMFLLKSNNRELMNLWISENFRTNNMVGMTAKEKKVISLMKRLAILFFIIFFITFLMIAESDLSK